MVLNEWQSRFVMLSIAPEIGFFVTTTNEFVSFVVGVHVLFLVVLFFVVWLQKLQTEDLI